jgi:hypothetical protein
MASINVTITASVQDFSTFADELGYLTEVQKSPAEIAALPEGHTIQDTLMPNPQSKTDFLIEYFKRITVTELARVKIANIQRQVDATKEAEKAAMRTAIEGAVSVNATA